MTLRDIVKELAGAAGQPEPVRLTGVALEESVCEYAQTVRANHLHIEHGRWISC